MKKHKNSKFTNYHMKQKLFLANLTPGKKKLWVCREIGCERRRYTFGVVLPSDFVPSMFKRVWTGHLPEIYEFQCPNFVGGMGHITYKIDGTRAHTVSYYPKEFVKEDKMRGLGYYLEYLATLDMLRSEITHIGTSIGPSEPRMEQLRKVGLPILADTPINVWIDGLLRGIREQVSRAEFGQTRDGGCIEARISA